MRTDGTIRLLRRVAALFLAASVMLVTACSGRRIGIEEAEFEHIQAVIPNPMKGFAAFYGKAGSDSSLEYIGLKFSEIYTLENGIGNLDTEEFDRRLSKVAERGHTAVVRVYLLYPGNNDGESAGLFLPEELYSLLSKSGAIYTDNYGGYPLEYPDFNNQSLIACLLDFIGRFGRKYDGHAAIAAVQMGLYGSWGEWNMSGCQNGQCAMTNDNLRRVIEAYVSAFRSTKLMARNPSLGGANEYPIGYHDDNFMFNSSDFHTVNPEWKALLMRQDRSYGSLQQFYDFIDGDGGKYPPLWNSWKTQMFGAELSGQMYKEPFGPLWNGTEREALEYCIHQFHVSWIMGVGIGGVPDSGTEEYREFMRIAGSMGYDIAIDSVTGREHTGKLETNLTNYGIAPFYYDWPIEYRITDDTGEVVYTCMDEEFRLSELLPGESAETVFFIPEDLRAGEYDVHLRFVNPAEQISKKVMPLRLSNDTTAKNGIYRIAHVTIQ